MATTFNKALWKQNAAHTNTVVYCMPRSENKDADTLLHQLEEVSTDDNPQMRVRSAQALD